MTMLTKDGITVDVSHPSDIARYKKLGYEEIKTKKFAAEQQAIADAALGAGSQPAEPVEPEVAPEEETEVAPEKTSKKGKAKK